MRTFIAIDIPENKAIKDLYQYLSGNITGAKIKYTATDCNHLTLAFLGEVDQERINLLENKLYGIQLGEPKLTFVLKGVGAFYSNKQPSVLWIGIEHTENLAKLQNTVQYCIQNAGIPIDTQKKFTPHITVGRIKLEERDNNIREIVEKSKSTEFGALEITHFKLYKSTLTPNGPIYEVLQSFPL